MLQQIIKFNVAMLIQKKIKFINTVERLFLVIFDVFFFDISLFDIFLFAILLQLRMWTFLFRNQQKVRREKTYLNHVVRALHK